MNIGNDRAAGWSAGDLAVLRQLWSDGTALAEIAGRLGRSPEAVRSRARRLHLAPRRTRATVPAAPAVQRPCLCCGAPFPSQGAHHRLCERCRDGSVADYRVAL